MNTFEEMKNFVRVVDSGSITKAAEQMNTVKSAVSRRLTELEKRLGVTLLTRTTRKQTLTDTGTSYYQQSLKILDDLLELESSIKNEQCALSGKIKIAAPLSFGLTHLAPALSRFNEIHTEIQLDIDFNDRKVDIIEEGYDLAFRIAELKDSNFIAKKVTTIRILLVASPDYLQKYGVPKIPKDLLNSHVKVQYKDSSETWEFIVDNKTEHIKITSVLNSNNGDFLLQAALEGKGLVMTPDFICYKYIKTGQLIPVLSKYTPIIEIGAYAVYPQARHLSRRVRSLVDYLTQYFGQKPYWQITK
jgi:DNA-binding transcriptional LysR family regulator